MRRNLLLTLSASLVTVAIAYAGRLPANVYWVKPTAPAPAPAAAAATNAPGGQPTYVRENLGSTREYTNPYDTRVPVELARTYQYYWVNRQGQYAGTNDPGVDMNQGSTDEWRRMPATRQ